MVSFYHSVSFTPYELHLNLMVQLTRIFAIFVVRAGREDGRQAISLEQVKHTTHPMILHKDCSYNFKKLTLVDNCFTICINHTALLPQLSTWSDTKKRLLHGSHDNSIIQASYSLVVKQSHSGSHFWCMTRQNIILMTTVSLTYWINALFALRLRMCRDFCYAACVMLYSAHQQYRGMSSFLLLKICKSCYPVLAKPDPPPHSQSLCLCQPLYGCWWSGSQCTLSETKYSSPVSDTMMSSLSWCAA